jgi:PAS domain S-box-containing protein
MTFHDAIPQGWTRPRVILSSLVLAALYFAVGRWGLHLYSLSGLAAPIWIPSGLSLAALVCYGLDLWPGILLGAFLTNWTLGANGPVALAIAGGNTLEALVSYFLLQQFGFNPALRKVRDVYTLTALVGITGALVSATIGVGVMNLAHMLHNASFLAHWQMWWWGDILSLWIIAPLGMVWVRQTTYPKWSYSQFLELVAMLGLITLVTQFVFGFQSTVPLDGMHLPYIIFPPALWLAYRLGPRGTVISNFLVAVIGIRHTVERTGPFGTWPIHYSFFSLQMFLGILALTSLVFAALVEERAESRLFITESERRFRSLIENSSDGILLLNAMGIVMYIAPTRRRLLGYPDEELIGHSVFDLLHPEDAPSVHHAFQELLSQSSHVATVQARVRHQEGSWRWVEATASNALDNPSMHAIVVNFHDVTLNKEAEALLRQSHEDLEQRVEERTRDLIEANARLRESEERFRLLVEGVEEYAIFSLDLNGNVTTWNSGAERLKKYQAAEIIGSHFSRFYTPEDIQNEKPQRFLQRAAQEGHARDEGWRIRKDGSRFFADVLLTALRDKSGQLKGYAKLTRDITSRVEMERALQLKEEELFQARKLEAIGRLAGGVAHDFNNLITGILGISQELKNTLSTNDPRREEVEEVIKASHRAFDVTRQLLAFGRRQIVSPKIIDLNASIRDFTRLLHRLIGEDVRLELSLGEAGHVKMDPGNLSQILLNLTLNARDAMPRGGTITLRTFTLPVQANSSMPQPHPTVVLEVSDSGKGMNKETLDHIFEPFFTTKTEKGTGLGLATVYGIVKQSDGDITVHSEENQGTVFRITLPQASHEPVLEHPVSLSRPSVGHETILVIEDEDIVRRVVVKRLKNAGYTVFDASDGKKALDLWSERGSEVQMIITDVVMPEMNGREVVTRIRTTHPAVAVLYMSGYPEEIITHRGTLEPGINFIEKAALQRDLLPTVRGVLEKTYAVSGHSPSGQN